MRKIITIILFISFGLNSFGQTSDDKSEAYDIAKEAIKIMDNGEIEKSIGMLKKAQKLDPENYLYPYEIGYAYLLQKDYKNAIKTLKPVLKYKDNNDQCFTLLGNTYDTDKQPEKAIEIYKKGLIKFPKSGRLHYELGNVQEVLKKYDDALTSWENGITVSPSYPSNYHTASIYYCKYTTEKIWGVIYGELFINIERGSEKTTQISKLLFDTYKSSITIKSKTEGGVSFSKSSQMTIPKEGEEIKLPFSMPYEITMILAITSELDKKELGIASLNNIRTSFINSWYENERNIEYPNILFDWHKKLIDLEYFESYNYWLLMKGNEDEFDNWVGSNKEKFDAFIEWFTKNPLKIDEQNNFKRLQYN
jgi:tetratricopeptide (TPR) repeat protein|tara:strand:+ start:65 stop:1156 length:1092 start_codon:yes stop_codon:yes gene_type:complete